MYAVTQDPATGLAAKGNLILYQDQRGPHRARFDWGSVFSIDVRKQMVLFCVIYMYFKEMVSIDVRQKANVFLFHRCT